MNLVLGSLLKCFGFKLVFKADRVVISKGWVFDGNGYVYGRMLNLSINNINNISAYICDLLFTT